MSSWKPNRRKAYIKLPERSKIRCDGASEPSHENVISAKITKSSNDHQQRVHPNKEPDTRKAPEFIHQPHTEGKRSRWSPHKRNSRRISNRWGLRGTRRASQLQIPESVTSQDMEQGWKWHNEARKNRVMSKAFSNTDGTPQTAHVTTEATRYAFIPPLVCTADFQQHPWGRAFAPTRKRSLPGSATTIGNPRAFQSILYQNRRSEERRICGPDTKDFSFEDPLNFLQIKKG